MNAAILASGGPTRFAGDPRGKAKAMVRIGDHPILWHLLKYYEYYGFGEFVVAVGHGGHAIRTYFDQLGHRQPPRHDGACVTIFPSAEPAWTVKLVDTGEATMSGGQIKRLEPYLDQSPFMLTSCDRLADVDLDKLRTFHRSHGGLATLTAIHPPTRFGRITLDDDQITAFEAKGIDGAAWVNGAFFALDPGVFAFIAGDDTEFERAPLSTLATAGELMAYRHESFWQCMDTVGDAQRLNALWHSGRAPWKVWS